MAEIIFHIGTHKTGTTTLQRTLGKAQDEGRLSPIGVYYPKSGRVGGEGHHNLIYELVSQWRFNPRQGGWADLEAELRGREEDVVVISSESFSGYRGRAELAERCAALARTLKRRPRVVAYLRPQFAYLESVYAQNAATGYTGRKFDRYLLESVASGAADYGAMLHKWRDCFGTCEVYPFRPEAGRPLLAQVFDQVLGIDLPEAIVEQRANDRRGVRAVEFARRVTETQERAGADIKQRTALAKRVSQTCARAFPREPRFAAMDAALAATVQKLHDAPNRALFAEYPDLEPAFADILRKHDTQPNALDLDSAGPRLHQEYENVLTRALRGFVGPSGEGTRERKTKDPAVRGGDETAMDTTSDC